MEEIIIDFKKTEQKEYQSSYWVTIFEKLKEKISLSKSKKFGNWKFGPKYYSMNIVEITSIINIKTGVKIWEDGSLFFYKVGNKGKINWEKFHRLKHPAILYADKDYWWFEEGKYIKEV